MANETNELAGLEAAVEKAVTVGDEDALQRLLKDLARVKRRSFPKKKTYKGETLSANLPVFLKACEIEARTYGLLNGVPSGTTERLGQVDAGVLEDAKWVAELVIKCKYLSGMTPEEAAGRLTDKQRARLILMDRSGQ
jgi:hypothetical protein